MSETYERERDATLAAIERLYAECDEHEHDCEHDHCQHCSDVMLLDEALSTLRSIATRDYLTAADAQLIRDARIALSGEGVLG